MTRAHTAASPATPGEARAPSGEIDRGLLGCVAFNLDGVLQVDGVALRRRLDGGRTLSFPCRKGKVGDSHPFLRPLDAQAREVIERQVFEALGLDGRAA